MQNIEKERHSWAKLSFILLLLSGLAFATASSGDDIALNLDDQSLITTLKLFQALSVIIFFIAPSILFASIGTKAGIRYLGILNKPSFSTLVIAGLAIICALPLINALAELNQHMHLPGALRNLEEWMVKSEDRMKDLTEAFMQGTSVGTLISNLFVVAFLAALSEELLFRGVIQKLLIDCFKNKHVGVWIGAIIFSAFHLQFFGFLPRMLMGAYLGYLFVWSGSLWPGVLVHFLNNGLAVYVTWLMNRGTVTKEVETVGANGNDWIYAIISGIIVIISLILIHRVEKKKQNESVILEENI